MKWSFFLLLLGLLFTAPVWGKKGTETSSSYPTIDHPLIKLHEDNHVVLRGPVNTASASKVIEGLHTKGDDQVYLYINSPGGSVVDGHHIINAIDALYRDGKQVVCIADTAISMAFAIFQSCPVRYVRPSSILMQHQMSFGTRGPIEHVRNYVHFVDGMEVELNRRQAERLGMTMEEFKTRTISDWWIYGSGNLEHNLSDGMVHLLCGADEFQHTAPIKIQTIFGPITVHFSRCPLLNDPVKLEYEGDTLPVDQEQQIRDGLAKMMGEDLEDDDWYKLHEIFLEL